ncbi:hypothetical protein TNIN_152432 [Trichonephila inaurata madagascariensis]|uniref:Uncharacterized protein n=1 Tax=Trichonephila inaurata madagascariensis TaxID=2747483 RepID=A0A8X6YDG1_9ARAC|nr:hypothetical protein TNIN_152432 [Trichonephila inaurata madagascariensis]
MESEVAKEKVAAKLQVDDTTIRDTGLTLLQEDDTAIPDIGLELKKMTYEFEEMLKKRLADSEKVDQIANECIEMELLCLMK